MASKSNVNPNHYKTAGRDPQGRSVLQEVERQKLQEGQARLSRGTASPVAAPRRKKTPAAPAAPKQLAESATARVTLPMAKNLDENLQGSDKRGKEFDGAKEG